MHSSIVEDIFISGIEKQVFRDYENIFNNCLLSYNFLMLYAK